MSTPLLKKAVGFRHGLLLPPSISPGRVCDIAGVYNCGIPLSVDEHALSAAGGVGRSIDQAETAAIGEALERYTAQSAALPLEKISAIKNHDYIPPPEWSFFSPEQVAGEDFPFRRFYDGDIDYAPVFSLKDNRQYWVPAGLIGLRAVPGENFATSNGLAAGSSRMQALLRAVQELVERDAFMAMWRHGISLPRVEVYPDCHYQVVNAGGMIGALDMTPAYSPHFVAMVYGELPMKGLRRISIGTACRQTWDEAVDKAYLEWTQGVTFIGVRSSQPSQTSLNSYTDVKSFNDHALYYTSNPDQWDELPFFRSTARRSPANSKPKSTDGSAVDQLQTLVKWLEKRGINLYYRDLTTRETSQVGVYVVRVLSPQLTGINSQGAFPFLGGNLKDLQLRFEGRHDSRYPFMAPHPLG